MDDNVVPLPIIPINELESKKTLRYSVGRARDGRHVRVEFDASINAMELTPQQARALSNMLRASAAICDAAKPPIRIKKWEKRNATR